ncbi:MAG: protein kinase domain-containing protein [Kofleriaceae bacterium]
MRDGTVLGGRFELRGWATGGALGEVLRARDRTTNATVAVRIGPPSSARDDHHARRLNLAAALRVPELVEIVAHGETDDAERYVVLAWIDGTTALDRLRSPGLTAREATTIALDVARGLAALHAAGVVHGAPTADHVVVRDRRATLLDPPAIPDTASTQDDVRALGHLLVMLLAGRASDGEVCPPLPGRVPVVVATWIDEMLARTITADTVVARLATLGEIDDTHAITYRGTSFDPEATGDVRGGHERSALAHDDTAAAGHVLTPDLSDTEESGGALVVKTTNRYRLEQVIGQGGLGRVVLAHDRELGRPVAIKELLRQSPHSVARFQREAMVTARLQHPGIVPVHEAGRWPNGAPYYAMKLVEGQDLAQAIAAASDLAGRLSLLPRVIAVADAIAYAHEHRIIHRDLKPSNVVLGEFGETLVIDWGLAKDLDADEIVDASVDDPYRSDAAPAALTRAGDVLGTPAYMAPEQARGEAVDTYTDVYALGAMLYHLLAGLPPKPSSETRTRRGFTRARDTSVDEPVALGTLVPEAPVELVAIATKAMATSPADRYPSANELALELRRFQTGQLVSAHTYSLVQMLRRWGRRHRAVLAVGAILVSISLMLGAYALIRIVRAEKSAVRERAVAIEERSRAEAERDRLRVEQAEAIVHEDPTAAFELLRFEKPLPDDLGARAVRVVTRAAASGLALARPELPGRIIALAAGGGRVFAISGDGTLATWDRDGREIERLTLGAPPVALAVAPDGRQRATITADLRLRWWTADAGAPREIAVPAATDALVFAGTTSLAFIPMRGQVWLWNGTGAPTIHHLPGASILRSLGDGVVVGSDDGSLASVNADGVRWQHPAHTGTLSAIAVSRDEIITAGADGVARRWAAHDGAARGELAIGIAPSLLAVRGDEVLAAGDDALLLRAGSTRTSEPLPFPASALCGEACGAEVVATGPDLWIARDGDRRVLRGHRDRIDAVVALDGDTLVSGDRTGQIRIWRLPAPDRIVLTDVRTAPVLGKRGWIVGLASGEIVELAGDGTRSTLGTLPGAATLVAARANVVAATSAERVRVWRDGVLVVDAAVTGALRMWLRADGAYVGVYADRAEVFDTRSGAKIVDLPDVTDFVLPVGDRVFVGIAGRLHVVPLDAGSTAIETTARALPFEPVLAAELADGGVAVASISGALALFDPDGRQRGQASLGGETLSLAGSRDGLLAGGSDGTVRRWRSADGSHHDLTFGHDRWVHGTDTSGEWIASWSRAMGEVRVWRSTDRASGVVVTRDRVVGAAFDQTGDRLVIVDRSGVARIVLVSEVGIVAPAGLSAFVADLSREVGR